MTSSPVIATAAAAVAAVAAAGLTTAHVVCIAACLIVRTASLATAADGAAVCVPAATAMLWPASGSAVATATTPAATS